LFYRLGLPMIVGQLVAGMLVGPFGLGLIRDTTAIDFLATLGIILLLFVVGLELDPRKFGKVGSRVLILSTWSFLLPSQSAYCQLFLQAGISGQRSFSGPSSVSAARL